MNPTVAHALLCRVESHSTPGRPGVASVGMSADAARKSACATVGLLLRLAAFQNAAHELPDLRIAVGRHLLLSLRRPIRTIRVQPIQPRAYLPVPTSEPFHQLLPARP